jgi:hypothetical protein
MSARVVALALTGLFMFPVAVGTALGQEAPCQPPNTWIAVYQLHETPTDPNSRVTYKVRLDLASEDTDCASVGWRIDSIEVRQVHLDSSETVWREAAPEVSSPDGLWWVAHANVSSPQMSEFVLPPFLSGVAEAETQQVPDLAYALEGAVYTPPEPPNMPPYDITAAVNYEFRLVSETEPMANGEEEPLEVPPVPPV